MGEVRKDIRFNEPYLKNLQFDVNDNFNVEKFEGISEVKLEISKGFQKDYDKENDLKGSSLVSIEIEIGGKEDVNPFHIITKVEAIFEWDNFKPDEVDNYLNINAAAILYSYCRPHISYITSASGLPTYTLPFYNFTNNKIDS
ncbi:MULTISPECIES: protein-export chaperone SecB [Staphylococcus]|uniref:protein-export chaperone SecB n=1 Tax=Staphylococcus TaxID=1279 RepID=UPI000267DEF8|nr:MULTISPECIES: protein-export chaperone SecB [Staphylococcus]MBM6139442.1 protein-export chaperone SecB [Staphylococcus epidermidis]MBM6270728.1 protein-export chaperone SecB [Staphylococcus epidermidis]MBM6273087.1 protein-export chaperone SecB [Staphylococcus epidermidis]MBM6275538.1 protein-export chaperone SecB [Staphylococcus epidermidis]MBM6277956.1 protein-export chaperone SecB [Staphylococcus epidermidis]